MDFGLVGLSLSHSFSARYFKEKFKHSKHSYTPIELEEHQIEDFLLHTDLDGFNVTIPYKQSILPLLDHLSPIARSVNAVNTVKRTSNGWMGENTDIIGFQKCLVGHDYADKKMLILGTGGAAQAVIHVCNSLGIDYNLVSRRDHDHTITYSQVDPDCIRSHSIIVNTTPLGMYPDEKNCPDIAYDGIGYNHICIDLIYNPEETLFLKKARLRGATTENGLQMLYNQADASFDFWTSTVQ